MELTPGQTVNLTIGEKATVVKELGRGGQGIVYLVKVGKKDMALKWYINPPDDKFYHNLEKNVSSGAPNAAFIWPEYLTVRENGSYGYIMRLRPKDYYEFGTFLLARVNFRSFHAMLTAALKICAGFKVLHLQGYSYQDLNDGNFFINPENGDVLICDNDNVMAQGEKSGILGKARYMAPEVMAGSAPDKYSDRFSLAVILFMLFFANHPFEGAKVVACPCMTEAYEKKFYGSEALFIFDPKDKSNLPVRGVHQNVIRRWPHFPERLRRAFTEEFDSEHLQNPKKRMIENMWERLIMQVRDELIRCPHCKEETFVESSLASDKCMNCGHPINLSQRIKIGQREMMLALESPLYVDGDEIADAKVVASPKGDGALWLQNVSPKAWTVETASGKLKQVEPQGMMPVRTGMKISFGLDNLKGEVVAK
ncbi:MAG: serine/threonine-protein kinase [Bacteroidales bacterium]|nr:serine/threonine-protein kinase [Bacteroidales bacterium]